MDDSNSIWAQASAKFIEANTVEPKRLGDKLSTKVRDVNLVFVGSAQSGKTSLIHAYLSSIPVSEVKESSNNNNAIARLSSSIERDVHGLVEYYSLELVSCTLHQYEISGGAKLSSLLDIIVTPSNIHNTMVYISVDGANPVYSIDHANQWQLKIKQRIHQCFQDLVARGKDTAVIPQRQMKLTSSLLPDAHPDKAALKPTPIPVCILLMKFDIFNTYNMHGNACHTNTAAFLRYFAHRNGLSLLYTSQSFKSALKVLHNRTNRFITETYYPLNTTGSSKPIMPLQVDAAKPISVFFGNDVYSNILQAGVTGLTASMSTEQLLTNYKKNMTSLIQSNTDQKHLMAPDIELALFHAINKNNNNNTNLDQSIWNTLNTKKEIAAILNIDAVTEQAHDPVIDKALAEAAVYISRAKQDAILAEKIREKENQIAFAST